MCVLCSNEFLHLCFSSLFLHCLHLCVCIIRIGLYFLALSFLDYFTTLITKSSIDTNSLWKQLFRKEPAMKLRFQMHGSKDWSTDSSEDALDGHELSAGVRRYSNSHRRDMYARSVCSLRVWSKTPQHNRHLRNFGEYITKHCEKIKQLTN